MRFRLLPFILLPLFGCSPEPSPDSNNSVSVAPQPGSPEPTDPPNEIQAAAVETSSATDTDPVLELEWDALIPPDFLPEKLMERYNIDDLADDDPRAEALMSEMEEQWRNAPAVEALDDSRVKLPGFVVPLESDGDGVTDFLLVPYFGACIHVPPPPANQIVYVESRGPEAKVRAEFDTVWVTGRLRVERTEASMGAAGYRLAASLVEPYE